MGGLLLNKMVVKNSSDHQQNTVLTFYIALRHLFAGCSFITVTLLYSHCLQYLLYSVSSLLISMSLKTGALKPPRQSPATGCGVHICLWLSKEVYVGQHKAVPLLLLFDPSKLHVLKACNRPELHFAFVSHSSVPERT